MANNPETEFNGAMDGDTTQHVRPRPLQSASAKLRSVYLTGDETGNSPRDGGAARRGEKKP